MLMEKIWKNITALRYLLKKYIHKSLYIKERKTRGTIFSSEFVFCASEYTETCEFYKGLERGWVPQRIFTSLAFSWFADTVCNQCLLSTEICLRRNCAPVKTSKTMPVTVAQLHEYSRGEHTFHDIPLQTTCSSNTCTPYMEPRCVQKHANDTEYFPISTIQRGRGS